MQFDILFTQHFNENLQVIKFGVYTLRIQALLIVFSVRLTSVTKRNIMMVV